MKKPAARDSRPEVCSPNQGNLLQISAKLSWSVVRRWTYNDSYLSNFLRGDKLRN